MEVPGGYNNKTFVMMSEILGTMFVMIAVNWGATSDATPQCVGLMVFMLIQIFGQVSGDILIQLSPSLSSSKKAQLTG